MSELSVVVCTRDRPASLAACLRALEAEASGIAELVVVAGGAGVAEVERAASLFSGASRVLICEDKNICKARNMGLAACRTGLAAFIDDDATVRAGWSGAMSGAFAGEPGVWAVGGHAFDAREPTETLEFAFGVVDRFGRQRPVVLREGVGSGKVGGRWLANVKGCNFAVRVSQVRELGGFDEFYRFSYDETDLVLRVWEAGGRVAHAPGCAVDHWHTPGLFRGAGSLDRDWETEFASHAYFVARHARGAGRVWGRARVRLRAAKLGVRGAAAALLGGGGGGEGRGWSAGWGGVRSAVRGIRLGERAALRRASDP